MSTGDNEQSLPYYSLNAHIVLLIENIIVGAVKIALELSYFIVVTYKLRDRILFGKEGYMWNFGGMDSSEL